MLRHLTDIDLMPGAPVELLLAALATGRSPCACAAASMRSAASWPPQSASNSCAIPARRAGGKRCQGMRPNQSVVERTAEQEQDGAGCGEEDGQLALLLVHAHLRADLVVDGLQRF